MASISVEKPSGAAGASVYTFGSGFGSAETVAVHVRGEFAGAFPCDAGGAFSGELKVPANLPTGATKAAAIGNASGTQASVTYTIT